MKKRAIASVALAAALFAVSCQKENNPVQNVSGPMTISAVSEGLNTPTKTEMIFKYDVAWSANDKIYVKDASGNHDTFTLQNGAGTTKGTFKQDGQVTFTGEVQAYYPATMLDGGSPVWPASQADDQTIPMYCKKTLSSVAEERMDFSSLGSVLQLTFSTTSSDIVLKSIEVEADEAMSGAFTVENGQAKVSQPEGDKPGITLNLGDEGVKVGVTAKKFNIAVPAGEYNNLTITFIAKDGQKCPIHATKAQNLVFNTVNTLAVSGKFKPDLPAGALPGVFTVSNDNGTTKTQIYFSQGNLWYGKVGDAQTATFNFEANQYDSTPSADGVWDASHVSHFFWSKDERVAYSDDYHTANSTYGITPVATDVFFTNADETTAKASFTVNVGGKEQSGWRALSTKEWQYLLNTRTVKGGTKEGKSYQRATINSDATSVYGMILYPDNYTSRTDATSYTSTEWTTMEENGCVFLPAAGFRFGSDVGYVGDRGYYWSSTTFDECNAYDVSFVSFGVYPEYYVDHFNGYSVRLITESK